MGTSASHSTDANAGHENTAPPLNEKQPPKKADVGGILDRFSNAPSVIAVATTAFVCGQDRMKMLMPSDAGEAIHTLGRGLSDLRSVYEELDFAMTMEVEP
jgi:hypothetical protein